MPLRNAARLASPVNGSLARYAEAAHFWPVNEAATLPFIKQTVEVESEAVKLSDTFFETRREKLRLERTSCTTSVIFSVLPPGHCANGG